MSHGGRWGSRPGCHLLVEEGIAQFEPKPFLNRDLSWANVRFAWALSIFWLKPQYLWTTCFHLFWLSLRHTEFISHEPDGWPINLRLSVSAQWSNLLPGLNGPWWRSSLLGSLWRKFSIFWAGPRHSATMHACKHVCVCWEQVQISHKGLLSKKLTSN